MFLEATYGRSQNELAGCAQAQSSTGAIFCNNAGGTAGVPMTEYSSLAGAGLQGLPFLFPDATVLDPGYYAVSYRADQAEADDLIGVNRPATHIMRGTFVWDLPDLKNRQGFLRAAAHVINDWQLSGIWSGSTGAGYTIGYSYQGGGSSQNLTGSPDYGGRIRVVSDPGSGCSDDVHRQFDVTAFQGPLVGSVGLESGTGYLSGCFLSTLDLAIARNIRLGGGRNVQLRVDMFNAPNSAIITGRNTSISLNTPTDPITARNLPFENGVLVDSRSRPRGAGFGVATGYQNPRRVQFQVRFSF